MKYELVKFIRSDFVATIGLGIVIGFMIALYISQRQRLERFNASQCAVYGYESDCKTKLKGGELK